MENCRPAEWVDSNYEIYHINYYYGATSTAASFLGLNQYKTGSTNSYWYKKNAPISWLAVDTFDYNEFKCMIGVTVDVYVRNKVTNKYYLLNFILTTTEYVWDLYEYRYNTPVYNYSAFDFEVIEFGREY